MGNFCSISIDIARCWDCVARCWDCVAAHTKYTCNLEENLKDLKTGLDGLRALRDDVKSKVDHAEQQHLKTLNQVQHWLSRVENLTAEANQLIDDGPSEIQKLCLAGCFSKSCRSSYKFGKHVVKKIKDVANLKREGDNFKEVAERASVSQMNVRPIQPTVGLESTFDKVWSSLHNDRDGIIGLYGMGGVGKTTLLTQIHNKLHAESGFDVVIWVTVSKHLRLEKVQEEIGKLIGFSRKGFTNMKPDEKAQCIYTVLNQKKFVLLLDDIWERVDLTKVGIPLPSQENGSKLIFTTRSQDVCGQMEARKKVEVNCLTSGKAWELFLEKVGMETIYSHADIPDLAKQVAKECDGLPLALITIGRAMACKTTPEEWEYAIEVLKKSVSTVLPGMGTEVFPVLKFSYDNLSSDKIKSCFLYCSLYPEDFEIPKDELIDYWIGEGLLDEYDGQSGSRNQGHYIIGSLVHACLLEECEDAEKVKMHDVIRDMALWIEEEKCLVRAGAQLTEMPELAKWEKLKWLSLMRNKIEYLRQTPTCPNLQSLFLQRNRLKVISNDFFCFMPSLRVLDLSDNLQVDEVPLGILQLVLLEYLNLAGTRITQVPIELKSLTKLKCLNLDDTRSLNSIPQELISSFSKLEVFRMFNSGLFSSKSTMECNILSGGNECLVKELQCLRHLNTLSITLKSASALETLMSFHNLEKCIEGLTLAFFEDSKLNIASLANIRCLKRISLFRLDGFQEFKIESKIYFHGLRVVDLHGCSDMREVTWLLFAPNLRDLIVENCRNMKAIIDKEKVVSQFDEEAMANFRPLIQLKNLRLYNLPELQSIYWHPLAFPCLDSIGVADCPKLQKLPLNSDSAKGRKIQIRGHKDWWKALKWEDEATMVAFLPCFIDMVQYIRSDN